MQGSHLTSRLSPFIGVVMAVAFSSLDDKPDTNDDTSNAAIRRASQRALEPLNDWVGTWRGVGQPKRGSSKGAWTEESEWAWKIERDRVGLQFETKEGKQLQSGLLTFDTTAKKYHFDGKLPGGETRTYVGERGDEGKLILTSSADNDEQYRLTFQLRHEDRMLLLLETKPAGQTTFARVAEIGYTRKGGSFASAAEAGPKCIVTGGRGSIAVEYKGKTYYVCCTGCKTAFQEDPEGVIAEASERTKAERAKKNANK